VALSAQQEAVVCLAEEGTSFFLTGGAGTGDYIYIYMYININIYM
jgi:hypothetical protein